MAADGNIPERHSPAQLQRGEKRQWRFRAGNQSPLSERPSGATRAKSGAPLRGVILAGGLGTRLYPLTKITNKHLLPVYDRPMIFYPLQTMVAAGITEILLVTGGEHAGDFLRLLENGEAFGCSLRYAYQHGEDGIAAALRLARPFAAGEKLAVMLGDNLYQNGIASAVREFAAQAEGARLLLKQVPDPERFGVATLEGGRIGSIEEKPLHPRSAWAVTGCYLYDATVFDKIDRCRPSARQELEITDVNNLYLADRQLEYSLVEGWWSDAGTFASLHRASVLIEAATHMGRNPPRATLGVNHDAS